MIRMVSTIGFGVTLVGIALHYRAARAALKAGNPTAPAGDQPAQAPLAGLTRLASLLTLAGLGILAVTGFGPLLLLARPMSGFTLLAHLVAAPVFAVGLAYLTLMGAHHHRFGPGEWPGVKGRQAGDGGGPPGRFSVGQKISFWLAILLALPVILSTVLSMFPLFGTAGQERLLEVHRYSSVLLVMAIMIYTYLTVFHRVGPKKN